MDSSEVSWRDTMRPVRFYLFDARLLVLFVIWIFIPSWWTTGLVILAMAVFRMAEARGYRFRAALRAVRARAAGERRALYPERLRRFVDFG